jgi:serine/threonine-protein kinase
MKPLGGEESATVWRQGERLFHAVSVPMQTGPDLKGVLIAGYGIGENLAGDIRKLTHSEIAFLTRSPGASPRLSVSSLGPKEAALKAVLDQPAIAPPTSAAPFQLDLGGERHIAVQSPLEAATGEVAGSVLALRSMEVEMASFRQFRRSLILVSLGVMAVALGLAYLVASRISGPVRLLVSLVERARDGSYSGKVAVESSDEIGILARAFSSLLAELREKQQTIEYLREGLTLLKQGSQGLQLEPIDERSTITMAAVSGVELEPGTVFAGRYEIEERVGRGGMGVVLRARDRQLDEVVALKILRHEALSTDDTLLPRFKQELKLARRITHRNVLRTHDFGEADGIPYISMEYVEGVTLKDLVRSKGALPLGVGLRVAKQACQGLEAAHAEGVVHRDIKPQNMLILPETGELKIMDFGIARVSEVKGASGLTTDGAVLGTPDYMAPEQAKGAAVDFRSDIYSLGVVLFEMFTGRVLFPSERVVDVIVSHIQKPAPRPRSINPGLPERLEVIILQCLEKAPAKRYQKVGDLLKELTTVSSEAGAAVA